MKLFFSMLVLLSYAFSGRASDEAVKCEFVLPNGFRGVFKVIEDAEATQVAQPVEGLVRIRVPPSGIVVLKSTAILQQWHKSTAVYENGVKLPAGIVKLKDAETVAFFGIFAGDGAIHYFVGTKDAYEKIQKVSPWKIDDFLPKNRGSQ